MTDYQILVVHIITGGVGFISGVAALYFRKGGSWHNISGKVYVLSMLIMTVTAAHVAYVTSASDSFFVSTMVFYLVATAWMTVIRKAGEIGFFEYGATLFVLAYGVGALSIAAKVEREEAEPLYLIATLAALLAAGDIHMIARGGLSGPLRIARHLWRMCFALLWAVLAVIARPQLFPDLIRDTHMLFVPVVALVVLMIYWLYRILFARHYGKVRKALLKSP